MVYMYHSFLIHLSADGHLGCFHVLAIINSAAMNIGVHVSLSDLVSSVCVPRSGTAGSYGSSISSFLRLFYLTVLSATEIEVKSQLNLLQFWCLFGGSISSHLMCLYALLVKLHLELLGSPNKFLPLLLQSIFFTSGNPFLSWSPFCLILT